MQAAIILPELGADPEEPMRLSVWFADLGDLVYEGDRLVEVLVAGATFDVSAPANGRLAEVLVYPDEIVRKGQVLGLVEIEEGANERA
jgi:pyruvate/2-oxoglutarate dehydrogenase complex dihydrolipoamide acyltransferase (E2) component